MSKQAKEYQARQTHKEKLRSAKRAKRNEAPILERDIPIRHVVRQFLIVSEGVNTEVSYFQQFKLPNVRVVPIGTGYNTISLVEKAIELAAEPKYVGFEVWCVFDKDSFPNERFNEAVRLAILHFGRVAYSNQAFEYWLILHFEDHQGGAMDRKLYDLKINQYLAPHKLFYDGNGSKKVDKDFFELMLAKDPKNGKSRQMNAITRAQNIFKQYTHQSPATEESSTTVFQLIEAINGKDDKDIEGMSWKI
jgi:hypothetical protein